MKIAAVDSPFEAILGAFLIMIFVLPLSLEFAMLLEFRGVDLFDYGSTAANRIRDQWLGKAFLRVLLIGGNVALAIIFYKMISK
ncbi:MAG: hypothetical protein KF865_02325 [Bdellovibrionaceae bacterium]|nr:hypothetical protein [Pseudobdellovibrionaceae bacterium]